MLHRPRSTAEALDFLAAGPATLIAGGTDVFPALVDRPPPERLIDLTSIPGLRGIAVGRDAIRIGAATTWTDIARADLPPSCRMLQMAAREIGAIQIQNRATIGGNLCNASPAADGAPPLIALDAQVELASSRGLRVAPVENFLIGNRKTLRAADEIMTAVVIPRAFDDALSVFLKLGARKYLVISIVMAAALVDLDSERRVRVARIAVGAASASARRLRNLESRLVGMPADGDFRARIEDADFAALSPIDDVRATAAYRIDAARELVARALRLAGGAKDA
ncbi:MAG: xanthine dehydrogenase family protein subunit M [Hyphomicrobiales bacterium]|nr:xanthine dehydrogenase family protein subunit M [Hyphomicrobiales bacterium]